MQFHMDLGESEEDDRIYFAGFLANVNSDILKLKLDREFNIREVARKERDELLSKLEKVPLGEPNFESDIGRLRWTDKSYIIENTFDSWATTAGENEEGIVLDLDYNDAARVTLYLEPALRSLR